jgi:predicted nucleotidyltransferase
MRRDTVLDALRAQKGTLTAMGVGELYLFGSVARGDARVNSDIDLLVEPSIAEFSIFDLAVLKRKLEEILAAPVDVHDYGGFRRLDAVRRAVGQDIMRVF